MKVSLLEDILIQILSYFPINSNTVDFTMNLTSKINLASLDIISHFSEILMRTFFFFYFIIQKGPKVAIVNGILNIH